MAESQYGWLVMCSPAPGFPGPQLYLKTPMTPDGVPAMSDRQWVLDAGAATRYVHDQALAIAAELPTVPGRAKPCARAASVSPIPEVESFAQKPASPPGPTITRGGGSPEVPGAPQQAPAIPPMRFLSPVTPPPLQDRASPFPEGNELPDRAATPFQKVSRPLPSPPAQSPAPQAAKPAVKFSEQPEGMQRQILSRLTPGERLAIYCQRLFGAALYLAALPDAIEARPLDWLQQWAKLLRSIQLAQQQLTEAEKTLVRSIEPLAAAIAAKEYATTLPDRLPDTIAVSEAGLMMLPLLD